MDVNANFYNVYAPDSKTSLKSEGSKNEANLACTCERKDSTILCKMCGFLLQGRIMRMTCPVHPRVYHLMDFSHCPHCHSTCLKECGTAAPQTRKSM